MNQKNETLAKRTTRIEQGRRYSTYSSSIDAIMAALAEVSPVPGRMQCLRETGTPLAVVDYAHTPDALAQALKAARQHTNAKLWVVFGCGMFSCVDSLGRVKNSNCFCFPPNCFSTSTVDEPLPNTC